MNRQTQLKNLYDTARKFFPAEDRGYINHFTPGAWIVQGAWQYRFDVCRKCGQVYYNKRQRGVHYKIHNWWHYCTKGVCDACHPIGINKINPPKSFNFTNVRD